jgi:TrmH family RNA methyltransferase
LDAPIERVFIAMESTRAEQIADLAASRGIEVVSASDRVLAALSDAATPQGVVAVAHSPDVSIDELSSDLDLALVLAEVRDPGNAGTLLRSAAAAGAGVVAFTAGSVDVLNPKTVRAGAGALFRVPIVRDEGMDRIAAALRARGLVLVAADARAEVRCDEFDLARPCAIVVGNEAWGLSAEVTGAVDAAVAIPMPGRIESLNAAVAGSVLLYESIRQRRTAETHGYPQASL